MDRADKIFTILALTLMIGILVCYHRPRGNLADIRLNTSATPNPFKRGPAYLLSALPSHRAQNDFQEPTSIYEPHDGIPL